MKNLDIREVVLGLVGPVNSTGCSRTDSKRIDNLRELIGLVDSLVTVIADCVEDQDSPEHSVREIGKKARHYLGNLRDSLNDDFEGTGR